MAGDEPVVVGLWLLGCGDHDDEEQSLGEYPVISRNLSFGPGGPNGAKTAGLLLGMLEAVRMAGLSAYTGVHGGWRHAHATAASHPRTCTHSCRRR